MHATEQVIVVDQHAQEQAPPVPECVLVLYNHYALLDPIDILPLKLQEPGDDTPPELRVRLRCSKPHRMPLRFVGSGTGGLSAI